MFAGGSENTRPALAAARGWKAKLELAQQSAVVAAVQREGQVDSEHSEQGGGCVQCTGPPKKEQMEISDFQGFPGFPDFRHFPDEFPL